MRKTAPICILITTLFVFAASDPNILLLNLTSNNSLTILAPLLNQNTSLTSAIENNITSLSMNTQFLPLFTYILSNTTIFNQLIPNISIIPPFAWTAPMNQSSKQAFLQQLMNASLTVFYASMMNEYYLTSETQCQQLLQAVIVTGWQDAINNILAPLTGSYFWNKRCILAQTNYILIADQKVSVLGYAEKLALVTVISRMKVVHSVIFGKK